MPVRIKKLLGFAALIPGLVIYLFAAAAIGEKIPDNQLLKVVYYGIAGIIWAFPVKYLMLWMNRPPTRARTPLTDNNETGS
ncbi:MAG: DUF2842 domain-containing protein [Pseudomonadota bacterium]